jgi:hypothetical protein
MKTWLEELVSLYSPVAAATWLVSPHPQLDGLSAIEAIYQHRQRDVARVVRQLVAGAYS